MDIDVEWEIENEAESQFNFQQEMYGFDTSAVTVTVKGFRFIGQPSVTPKRLKTYDTIDKTNCTSVQQTENFSQYSETHTETFSVTFGGKLSWVGAVTGSLTIPGGLTVGGSRTQGVDLTASTTFSSTSTRTVTQAGSPVLIPPCKRVRATREVWATEVSGQVAVDVRIQGNVTYSVDIDWWPDPEYDMDLDFVTTLYGTFSGIGGHAVRGTYQESPAVGCSPPCRIQTANAALVLPGTPRIVPNAHVATALAFRSKVALEGVAGAVIGEPFPFEENPELPLIVEVAMIPDLPGFNEIVGKGRMRVPLVGIEGVRKLNLPVTCQVPGELLGIAVETVALTVVQPVKISQVEI